MEISILISLLLWNYLFFFHYSRHDSNFRDNHDSEKYYLLSLYESWCILNAIFYYIYRNSPGCCLLPQILIWLIIWIILQSMTQILVMGVSPSLSLSSWSNLSRQKIMIKSNCFIIGQACLDVGAAPWRCFGMAIVNAVNV